jgi:2-polyprenyl-3-methyl-5-hydroxy-6-metoxy-1,4-benzoquinol methylase
MKFIPTFSENLARYVFALNYCVRKRVIDLGCQDCHGSYLLGYAAANVTAVDICWPEIVKARERIRFICPTQFIGCDFEKDFPEGEWDVAVCFEVIEHLENPDFFLNNVKDHLVKGGLFIFSVPHMVANRLHKQLYDEKKIKDLISKYFHEVEFHVQDKMIISNKPTY